LGWLYDVNGFILSVKGRVYFNDKNEELPAAVPLVSYLFKETHYWSVINGFINFLQLSNVKPTQVCSAPAVRQVISTTLAAPQREL
jgi:hypothetical protein